MPNVVERRENDAEQTTQDDAKRRGVSASIEPTIEELERATVDATLAGRHDVASVLADRLRARIALQHGPVVVLTRRSVRDAGST